MSLCLQSSYCTMRRQFSCCRLRPFLSTRRHEKDRLDTGHLVPAELVPLLWRRERHPFVPPPLFDPPDSPVPLRNTLAVWFKPRSYFGPTTPFSRYPVGAPRPAPARANCPKPKHRIPAVGHQGLKQDTAPLGGHGKKECCWL